MQLSCLISRLTVLLLLKRTCSPLQPVVSSLDDPVTYTRPGQEKSTPEAHMDT